jgi:DNA-binding LacI/PurR family transcriptional regulator
MAATLHDVARRAGVSFKTVSNVINDYPHVRETTRKKVIDAIRELDYRPNIAARQLRSGRSGVIGVAVPELGLPYFAELTAEVIEAAERRGLVVVIEQTNRSRQREIDVLTSTRRQMTDGLIFSPLELGTEDAALLQTDSPVVLLGERIFTDAVDHVTMRNVDAARAATEYLIGLGRTRIAAVGLHPGEVIGSAGLRFRGYCEALAAAGLPLEERLLIPAGAWHRRQGAEAAAGLLDAGLPFDGLFAFNDTLALGAAHGLQQAGLRVPEDVAVIGFDDLDDGQYATPTLTTVDAGRRQIAELAVDALVNRIENPRSPIRHIEVGFAIVERDSARPLGD